MQPVPQLSQQNKTQKRTITMNTNWIRTLTLSAAALAMGSVAYGQSRPAAEVPFSFRINGTELPAGKYSIDKPDTNARMVVRLTDGQNNQVAMAITEVHGEEGHPRLVFSCREGNACTLVQAWDTRGNGLQFNAPKPTSAEKESLAVIPLRRTKAAD
jgi:hypothetical protein